MTPEEQRALVGELKSLIENREKMAADVRGILAEEIPKAIEKAMGQRARSPFAEMSLLGDPLAPLPERPSAGDYLGGVERPRPVQRPLKQPIFDTLIVPEEGIAVEREISLFTDRKAFPDGTHKFRRHTNMTQDQMLGTPLEYDFSSLELRFEKWAHPDDVHKVLRGLHLSWVFGQNTPWLRLSASGFKPLIVLPHEVESMEEEVRRQLTLFSETGVWPAWTHDMKQDGKPHRIDSTEAFRCGVECTVSELHGPVTLKVLMQDTLFACL